MISITGLKGIPQIKLGADLGILIVKLAEEQGIGIMDGDIIVVTQKVVSKAEGRLVNVEEIEPSEFAKEISEGTERDPRHTEAILRESSRIIKMRGPVLIAETRHGFVCANAGVIAQTWRRASSAFFP
jgi:coenzyme F420-0:L-glutamate ligase/coenzyme F420-1:gamma-L-glutamate ligase